MKRTLVIVGSLVSLAASAENFNFLGQGYNPTASGIAGIKALLEKVKANPNKTDSGLSDTARQIEEISALLKEKEQKDELADERKSLLDKKDWNSQLSGFALAPNLKVREEIERKKADNEDILDTTATVNRPSAVNMSIMNNGNLENACTPNVDLATASSATAVTTQLNTMKAEIPKFLDREEEKVEKIEAENFAKAAEKLVALTTPDKSDKKLDEKLAGVDPVTGKEIVKKAQDDEDKKSDSLVQEIIAAVAESAKTLRDLKKSDRKMAEIAGATAEEMTNKVQVAMNAQLTAAQQLRKNCMKEANLLGQASNGNPTSLLGSAVDAMRQWAPSYANGGFLAMINGVAAGLTCPDISASIAQTWQPVLNSVEALRGATDPSTLASASLNVVEAAQANQAAIGPKFQPLIDRCNFAGRNRQKVEQFVASMGQALQNQRPGSRSGSVPRTNGTPGVTHIPTPTAH
ncbi:MAG: hypothetical protein HYR96_11940 [Deltaproteobacteria bacterium]|nr:hypothetical protein [Deltaproteobacteria bacterium]MBI3295098.1 hypothetical protein [Deltaproteobacteria bacterium]